MGNLAELAIISFPFLSQIRIPFSSATNILLRFSVQTADGFDASRLVAVCIHVMADLYFILAFNKPSQKKHLHSRAQK